LRVPLGPASIADEVAAKREPHPALARLARPTMTANRVRAKGYLPLQRQ